MFSNKRGTLVEDAIQSVLISAVFLFVMWQITDFAVERHTNWQELYAKDGGLLIDLLQAAPGDVSLSFSLQGYEHDYVAKLQDDRFSVGLVPTNPQISSLQNATLFTSYPFTRSSTYKIIPSESNKEFLILQKKGNTIMLLEEEDEESSACSEVSTTKELSEVSFILSSPSEIVNPTDAQKINSINDLLERKLITRSLSSSSENPILTLHQEFSESDELVINYFPNTPQSKKMACLLASNLQSLFEDELQNIFSSIRYKLDDAKSEESGLHIRIQLGQEQDFDLWQNKRQDIVNSLQDAIIDYFED